MPQRPLFDDLDLRIIDALAEDGRRPFTSVAAELGVAEATVRARVNRLQRRGAIRFVTDTRPHELGLLFAYLGIRIAGADVRGAIEAICRIPEAVYVIECTGTYDVLVEVVAKDGDDLLRLIQREVRQVPGVAHVDTYLGLRIAKGTFRYTDLGRAGEASGRFRRPGRRAVRPRAP
ncbi:MAG: transcriptional regulator [Actinomycetota bacterium]|jgi:Lrp/AsnC family transcriptional regulator for asnA, asnC and gidA|nr:MAG: transcriptional regulator [Actinomycetota bacterium]